MEEIYWITRLDSIVEWLRGLQAAGITVGVICLMVYMIWKYGTLAQRCENDFVQSKQYFNRFRNVGAVMLSVGLLIGIARSFVPTTKEACAIYVGGSVIDYVQGNDTIKALPDKMINFANEYLNQLIENNKQQNIHR